MKCTCGNNKFHAHQVTYIDVIVNEDGEFVSYPDDDRFELNISDTDEPYGPFTCTKCGKTYDELE